MGYTIQSGDTSGPLPKDSTSPSTPSKPPIPASTQPPCKSVKRSTSLETATTTTMAATTTTPRPHPPATAPSSAPQAAATAAATSSPTPAPPPPSPPPASWASYTFLWAQNSKLMSYSSSASEIAMIHRAIQTVSASSSVDVRCILIIIVQESGGNVRVGSTNNGVRNPGIMQSHNGVGFDERDPEGSILQMVRDGTEGTRDGDGLKQLVERYGNYYEAFRGYNSGSVNKNDLNDPVGATGDYVQKAANRLMGA
ncbi:MAG: hypothetical protein Q9169_007094 [Polycauliona sp. 2 TL-2023]